MDQETRQRLDRIERKLNSIGKRVYQKTTFEHLFETNVIKIVIGTVLIIHLLRGGDLTTIVEAIIKLL